MWIRHYLYPRWRWWVGIRNKGPLPLFWKLIVQASWDDFLRNHNDKPLQPVLWQSPEMTPSWLINSQRWKDNPCKERWHPYLQKLRLQLFQFWWLDFLWCPVPAPPCPNPPDQKTERGVSFTPACYGNFTVITNTTWTENSGHHSWLSDPETQETLCSILNCICLRQGWGRKWHFSIWNQHVFFFPLPLCSSCHIFWVHISNQLVGV